MKPMISPLCAAALALACALPALAQPEAGESPLSIHEPYLRGSSGLSGAGFMLIENAGARDCQLIGVTTPAAGKAELHTHIDEDGMMKMVHVPEGFTIPAGGHFALERGGPHVMLMDLTGPLDQGAEVAMSLDFGDCGALDITLPVDNDRRAGSHDMDHMDHDHGADAEGEHATH